MKRTLIALREIFVGFLLLLIFTKADDFLRDFLMFRNSETVAYNMYLEFLRWPLCLFFVFFGRIYLGVLCRKLFLGVNPPERSKPDKKRYRIRFSLFLILCLVMFACSFASRNVLLNDGSVKHYNVLSQQTDEKNLNDYESVTLSCETSVWISKTGNKSNISTICYNFVCNEELAFGFRNYVFYTDDFKSEEDIFAIKDVFSEKLTYFPEREISALEFDDIDEYYLYKELFPHNEESYEEYEEDTGTTYYDFGLN